ncbi:MAG: enoyl-CoA hydratase/isomerase family protein [Reyranella sp.]|nr:enoyl-CoA hydratase/isomerase family protein [Reyranella sp.]
MSPTPNMIAEKAGAVGRIVFNKPAKHNATSSDMWEAIPVILDEFEKDPAIRVVVVTGAGDKAFVSGADISEFETARSTPEQVRRYDEIGELANTRLTKCSKPTIARIRGYCVGGGLAVALTCDLRIASENSKFAVPAAKLGLGYRAAGIKTLMNVVGPAYAKEIFYTGRMFDAREAQQMGLLNRVVPDGELDAYVDNYCKLIGQNAPLTMHAAKRTIEELTRLDGQADLGRAAALVKQCFESEDYIEGRRAFMEKRKPVFRGR